MLYHDDMFCSQLLPVTNGVCRQRPETSCSLQLTLACIYVFDIGLGIHDFILLSWTQTPLTLLQQPTFQFVWECNERITCHKWG